MCFHYNCLFFLLNFSTKVCIVIPFESLSVNSQNSNWIVQVLLVDLLFFMPPITVHFSFCYPVISDPEYLKQLKNGFTGGQQRAGPINIPSGSLPWSSSTTATSPVSLLLYHLQHSHWIPLLNKLVLGKVMLWLNKTHNCPRTWWQ